MNREYSETPLEVFCLEANSAIDKEMRDIGDLLAARRRRNRVENSLRQCRLPGVVELGVPEHCH